MSKDLATNLRGRIAEQRETIETFARLHRELAEIRETLNVPEAVEKIELMLRVNADLLRFLNDELAGSLAALKRTPVVLAPVAVAAQ